MHICVVKPTYTPTTQDDVPRLVYSSKDRRLNFHSTAPLLQSHCNTGWKWHNETHNSHMFKTHRLHIYTCFMELCGAPFHSSHRCKVNIKHILHIPTIKWLVQGNVNGLLLKELLGNTSGAKQLKLTRRGTESRKEKDLVLVGIGLHKVAPAQPFLSAAGLGEPSLSLLKLKFTFSGKEFYFSVAC